MSAIRRILVVDDNHDSADSLAMILKRIGYSVETAYGGSAAVTAFESFGPEAVLLDIGMPDMDGYQLAIALRALPGYRGVPLVAVTGFALYDDRERALKSGFDAHLTKPINPISLLDLLAGLRHES